MKRAAVYIKRKAFYIHASSLTIDGVWVISEPVFHLSADCPDFELGRSLCAALCASKDGIPHPKSWREVLEPLLNIAGVETWSAFVSGARSVEVEERLRGRDLIPTRNLGAAEGFQPDEAKKRSMSLSVDPATIGNCIREMLVPAR